MHCAPNIYSSPEKPLKNSCYTLTKLKKIANNYNKKYEDKIIYTPKMSPNELYEIIRNKLNNQCGNNEICWVKQDFIKRTNDKELIKFTFRPPHPKGGKNMWLSTTNLVDVMRQYEKAYPNFKFIHALPIDFMEAYPEVVKLNYADLYKKGFDSFGVIFNTDPSYRSGEHWMSMFINLKPDNPSINFYDSTVTCPPPKEISEYIKYIVKYESKLQKLWGNKNTITINCNMVQHQKRNSECGTYSLYYITESLKGKSFEQISRNIVKDEEMNKKRNIFFSPSIAKN